MPRSTPQLDAVTRSHRAQRWLLALSARETAWVTTSLVFICGGALSLLLLVMGAVPAVPGLLALTVAALATGAVAPLLRDRGPVVVEATLTLGAVMVAGGVALSQDPSSPYALMFPWVALEGALLLSPRASLRLFLVTAVAHAAAVALTPGVAADDLGHLLVTIATTALLAAMAWALRLRADALITTLRDAAERDPLLGTYNRRGYADRLDEVLARACETGEPVTVVLGDLDHFKALNDRFGHRRGDDALRAFAAACGTYARTEDVVARIGGEELAMVLPGLDAEAGHAVAERLRQAVRDRLCVLGTPGTASFGQATWPRDGATAEALLDAADQALHVAKHRGRDRCEVFAPGIAEALAADRALPGSHDQLAAMLLLAETLDLRDASTARHSATVAALTEATARTLGWPPERVARVRLAGLLHDLGKLGVPDAILHKPGALTDAEYAEMRKHSAIGAQLLASAGLHDLAEWVLCHHERPDGRGYPEGRPADRIPHEARVLAVADAYEAMTADRVYRAALGPAVAAAELRRCAGSQFDPAVVDALLATVGAPAPAAAAT